MVEGIILHDRGSATPALFAHGQGPLVRCIRDLTNRLMCASIITTCLIAVVAVAVILGFLVFADGLNVAQSARVRIGASPTLNVA